MGHSKLHLATIHFQVQAASYFQAKYLEKLAKLTRPKFFEGREKGKGQKKKATLNNP